MSSSVSWLTGYVFTCNSVVGWGGWGGVGVGGWGVGVGVEDVSAYQCVYAPRVNKKNSFE